jgi:hypothetical protein
MASRSSSQILPAYIHRESVLPLLFRNATLFSYNVYDPFAIPLICTVCIDDKFVFANLSEKIPPMGFLRCEMREELKRISNVRILSMYTLCKHHL